MIIAVGDRMILGMHGFGFAQIHQICPNLINFSQKIFARRCICIPCILSSYGTGYVQFVQYHTTEEISELMF